MADWTLFLEPVIKVYVKKRILHHVKCQSGTGIERIKVTVVFKIVFLLRSSHG